MSFSVQEILKFTGGRVVNAALLGPSFESIQIERPVSLKGSQPTELAFFFSRAFQSELPEANPGVLITGEPFVKPLEAAQLPFWKRSVVIACADPYFAMAVLSEKFAPENSPSSHLESKNQTRDYHPSAWIHPSAEIAENVQIGPGCVVEAHVKIGRGTTLYAGCYLGPQVVLGEECVLFPRVCLYEKTTLGDRVRIHAGAVLGADGFGYAPRIVNRQVAGHQKIYHLGKVVIGDDVEIGANSTVDRGTFGETRIGKNAKIDNLVHIGHNASVDEGAILCGGICLAGNASIGKYVYIGGLSGVVNHVHVGDGAKIGAQTLVTKDVPPGGNAVGNPQREHREHFRAHALLSKLLADRRSEKS